MNNYYIYKHTCLINGKIYIGQTCQNPEQRWGKNGQKYKGCPYFYEAIQKYGWDNFKHEIIEKKLTSSEANIREEYWINFYKSNNKQYGYNLKSGGANNEYSLSSREKMSISATNRFQKEEERKKQSERLKQAYKNNPNLNKKIKQPIQCIETGEVFESLAAAAKWCGIRSLSSFGNYFRGESKSCGRHPITDEKLHWIKLEKEMK